MRLMPPPCLSSTTSSCQSFRTTPSSGTFSFVGKDRGFVVPVLVEQRQGVHHGAMPVVVTPERQHLQQRRHDAPVMMTVGGARHQLYPPFVSLIGLHLLNQILESSLADGGEDHFLHRAVRMSSGRLGDLVQQLRLAQDLLGILQQLAVHLLLGPRRPLDGRCESAVPPECR